MNTFGHRFRFTTFGESHGKALGCIVDGVPAGIKIDEEFIQNEMNRRKPGQNKYATSRKEGDVVPNNLPPAGNPYGRRGKNHL